jgi:thiamine-monophosphate kinase
MLDLSDGLAKDAARIAAASAVSIQIDPSQLIGFEAVLEGPAQALAINPGTQTADELTRNWVLGGGEDHSLLATFPAGATIPRGFKVIGKVVQQDQAAVHLGATPLSSANIDALGWDSVNSH